MDDLTRESFEQYIKEEEPDKRLRSYAWYTGIGLQAVDGLKTSKYLQELAIRNIEGEISLDEAQKLLTSYYKERPESEHSSENQGRTHEADQVSLRITDILSENAFSFTPTEYIAIHRRLFEGIYKHAGQIRDYNISKNEWVLDGKTVIYGSASELRATLEYDITQEDKFSFQGLTMEEAIRHLALFVSRLWQIHVFGEGNTRTTAVFFIKYLRKLGLSATNDIFAENAWYFRNAMVRANYSDIQNGVYETTEYLELFLRNLLYGEHNKLSNRAMHISGALEASSKPDIGTEKPDIGTEKPDIETVVNHAIPGHGKGKYKFSLNT